MSNLLVKHNRSFSPVRLPADQCLARRNAGCVAQIKVSIVIHYNEKDTIEKIVEAVRSAPVKYKVSKPEMSTPQLTYIRLDVLETVALYDRCLGPLSRLLDLLASRLFGKNVFLIASKDYGPSTLRPVPG